jgi:hypothetical protein
VLDKILRGTIVDFVPSARVRPDVTRLLELAWPHALLHQFRNVRFGDILVQSNTYVLRGSVPASSGYCLIGHPGMLTAGNTIRDLYERQSRAKPHAIRAFVSRPSRGSGTVKQHLARNPTAHRWLTVLASPRRI